MRVLSTSRRYSRASVLLLALLLFRAYIPVGFMPAAGAPFQLQICPAGLAMGTVAQHLHHHPGPHAEFENCPFGSAPVAGPIAHAVEFSAGGPLLFQAAFSPEAPRLSAKLERAHQPRGPPSLS
jgi:hypothetical protein